MDVISLLEQAGIGPLRISDTEIWAPCPKHEARTGKADTHPSWSLNREHHRHHCFSCGYSGTSLQSLLIDVTGSSPEDLDLNIAKGSFLRRMAEVGAEPAKVIEPVIERLSEWVLRKVFVDVPQRLLTFRHLTRQAIDAYGVRWSADTRQWVMPLRSLAGELLGAQYRQKGSVVTLPEGVPKGQILFGFNLVCESSYVTLVESPLDAVRLFGLGIPAVSSLGAWSTKEQVNILARTFPRVLVALDNDKVGREARDKTLDQLRRAGTAAIPWNYTGLVDDEGAPAKDPGDVDTDHALLESWHRTLRMGL